MGTIKTACLIKYSSVLNHRVFRHIRRSLLQVQLLAIRASQTSAAERLVPKNLLLTFATTKAGTQARNSPVTAVSPDRVNRLTGALLANTRYPQTLVLKVRYDKLAFPSAKRDPVTSGKAKAASQ